MLNKFKTPTLTPMLTSNTVTVPTSDFQNLISKVNEIVDVVNSLKSVSDIHSEELTTCKQNISNIAKILEEIYDEA